MQWERSGSGDLLWEFCDNIMLSPQTDFRVFVLKIPNTRYKVETRCLNVLNLTVSVWKRRPYDVSLWEMAHSFADGFVPLWMSSPVTKSLPAWDLMLQWQSVRFCMFCLWLSFHVSETSSSYPCVESFCKELLILFPWWKNVIVMCSIKILNKFCILNILCKIIRLLYYSAQMTGQLYSSCLWNEVNWVSGNFAFIHLWSVSIFDQRALYTWTSLSYRQHGLF